ncbi:phosphoglycerate mutase-like protein [Sodiomyces alkalinus F11]|uniref:Phosphoglycerate mutase-like protein n=1 Tax=Sodiomyces alkalinus (strain CBS 110278 / VKM F-3762 / F11) TaxID=1314773 RepID=A0A3N2Q9M2_SODAK|nr:phosphoglycerate mutase-like protein [Sodiomyces alkalinus F11]ROT43442.1 phosphoglycerate mutase-like protein [Sodiomyces alkalinus F11]
MNSSLIIRQMGTTVLLLANSGSRNMGHGCHPLAHVVIPCPYLKSIERPVATIVASGYKAVSFWAKFGPSTVKASKHIPQQSSLAHKTTKDLPLPSAPPSRPSRIWRLSFSFLYRFALSPYENAIGTFAMASLAQVSSNPTVWGSVAMVMQGETTPMYENVTSALTPRGAHQMYRQGAYFRSHYLVTDESLGDGRNQAAARPIRGIQGHAIDNSQLSILTGTDRHAIAGAGAFLQGLYPPVEDAFLDADMSYDAASDSSVNFPLQGYQYPAVNALSTSEENSIFLQGHVGCTEWYKAVDQLLSDPTFENQHLTSLEPYEMIFSRPPLNGTIPARLDVFHNPYAVYDYVSYLYHHNRTVYEGMQDRIFQEPSMSFIERNALQHELALNADATLSDATTDNPIRTIAGQTFAQGVLDALDNVIKSNGSTQKLTVMFASYHPFLAFFSLAQLNRKFLDPSSPFTTFPTPGAAMAFELIGDEPDRPSAFPSEDNLWVRFLYRRDVNESSHLRAESLFAMPRSDFTMPLATFRSEMSKFAVDVSTWCDTCGSPLQFCVARRDLVSGNYCQGCPSYDGGRSKGHIIAGFVGAGITLAVLLLILCLGRAIDCMRHNRGGGLVSSGIWGFSSGTRQGIKSAEKRASDVDLAVSRHGTRHERGGSWELRGGPALGMRAATAVSPVSGDHAVGLSKSASWTGRTREVQDDGQSMMSDDITLASPVHPHEGV